MKKPRILTLAMALCLAVSCVSPAFAADETTLESPVTLDTTAAIFDITVPTAIPMTQNTDGTITVADNLEVTNNSIAPIVISYIELSTVDAWSFDDYDKDFTDYAINRKRIGFLFNTIESYITDGVEMAFPAKINVMPGAALPIDYAAKMPKQNADASNIPVLTVKMTAKWFEHSFSGELDLSANTDDNLEYDIYACSYYGCTEVTSVIFPAKTIGIGARTFYGCTGISDLVIPDTVTEIGEDAFKDVPHVTYHGTATDSEGRTVDTGATWGAASIN